ncbi:glycosyltransferase family 4 protein [Lacibacter sp. H375]|uniref:glycosyltransferase family 4 protein n=1 Tax=Lacibacter sp. H375 TaxID=3133424 RepID=UPI0030C43096
MKKVLNIVPYPYLPYFSGGQKLIAHFNHYLGEQCVLHVAGTADNNAALANTYNFHPILRKGRFRYADISSFFPLQKLIKKEQIDTVIIEHPYLGWLGWLLKITCKIKLIIHTHNIEYERFRNFGKSWWPVLKSYESIVLRMADKVFCITEDDRQWMINNMKLQADKCIVVPYGITQKQMPDDKQHCKNALAKRHHFDPKHALFLFNGLLDYKPNLDALTAILEQINPLLLKTNLQYNIIITGKRLPAELNELKAWNQHHIHYAGFVDDIDLYFKAADLFLNPVQSGGGVKTKMIEAIACGTTVISTKTGAIGIEPSVTGEKLIIVADNDWNSFAKEILKHAQQQSNTPADYYQYYNWQHIAEQVVSSV